MVRFSQCHTPSSLAALAPVPSSMPQFRQLLIAFVVGTSACASGPEIRKLGDYPSVQPLFTTPANQKTPSEMTVNLARPSYVAALFVVPGRGAVIVYPSDSSADTHLDAGAHTIPVHFSERPFNRDSMLATLRRNSQGMGRGNPPPRVPRDTFSRDTVRVAGDTGTARVGSFRDASPG